MAELAAWVAAFQLIHASRQIIEVGQVLIAPRGPLVPFQVRQTDGIHFKTSEVCYHHEVPCEDFAASLRTSLAEAPGPVNGSDERLKLGRTSS